MGQFSKILKFEYIHTGQMNVRLFFTLILTLILILAHILYTKCGSQWLTCLAVTAENRARRTRMFGLTL